MVRQPSLKADYKDILPCRSSETGTDQVTRFLAALPSFSTKRRT